MAASGENARLSVGTPVYLWFPEHDKRRTQEPMSRRPWLKHGACGKVARLSKGFVLVHFDGAPKDDNDPIDESYIRVGQPAKKEIKDERSGELRPEVSRLMGKLQPAGGAGDGGSNGQGNDSFDD